MAEIIEKPFDWNDNLSEIAQEDFSLIQKSLSYGTVTSIGMALAKLKLLEKQGCRVSQSEKWIKQDEMQIVEEIRSEIMKCLDQLDQIENEAENSGFNLLSEISGERLAYKQCLEIIGNHNVESEE